MKKYIESGDKDTMASSRMWPPGEYGKKDRTTLFLIVHHWPIPVTKFLASCLLKCYAFFYIKKNILVLLR